MEGTILDRFNKLINRGTQFVDSKEDGLILRYINTAFIIGLPLAFFSLMIQGLSRDVFFSLEIIQILIIIVFGALILNFNFKGALQKSILLFFFLSYFIIVFDAFLISEDLLVELNGMAFIVIFTFLVKKFRYVILHTFLVLSIVITGKVLLTQGYIEPIFSYSNYLFTNALLFVIIALVVVVWIFFFR